MAEVARRGKGLLEEMRQAKEKILRSGVFDDEHQRDHVLSVYALSISALEKRLAK